MVFPASAGMNRTASRFSRHIPGAIPSEITYFRSGNARGPRRSQPSNDLAQRVLRAERGEVYRQRRCGGERVEEPRSRWQAASVSSGNMDTLSVQPDLVALE